MSCPWTDELVDACLRGEPVEEAHLETCPLCREAIEDTRSFAATLAGLSAPAGFAERVMSRLPALAGNGEASRPRIDRRRATRPQAPRWRRLGLSLTVALLLAAGTIIGIQRTMEPRAPAPGLVVSAPELEERAGEALVIAWDPALGELDLDVAGLPFGTGNLDRLVTRALFRGLPAVARVVERVVDRSWEFTLEATCWSDGRALTARDFEASWEQARRRFAQASYGPHLDPRQRALLEEMEIAVLGDRRLRITLREPCPDFCERLAMVPFLPSAGAASDAAAGLVSNGPYALIKSDRTEIVLARREAGAAGRRQVRIRLLEPQDRQESRRGEEQPRRADLIWSRPDSRRAQASLSSVGVSLHGNGQRFASELEQGLELARARIVASCQWIVAGRGAGRSAVLGRSSAAENAHLPVLRIGFDRDTLRPVAEQLREVLWNLGFTLMPEGMPHEGVEPPDLLLTSGVVEASLSMNDSFVVLGQLAVPVCNGRRRLANGSLDRFGFLCYPPNTQRKIAAWKRLEWRKNQRLKRRVRAVARPASMDPEQG